MGSLGGISGKKMKAILVDFLSFFTDLILICLLILGSLFNYINYLITKFRMRYLNSKISKVFEAILCGVTAGMYLFSKMINECGVVRLLVATKLILYDFSFNCFHFNATDWWLSSIWRWHQWWACSIVLPRREIFSCRIFVVQNSRRNCESLIPWQGRRP